MAESTAFQLMAQAVGVEPDMRNEWEKFLLEIWEIVKRDAADFIIKRDVTIQPADMKKLLPIHPYAAYLLKFISQQFSSNQRTMFQFLCANYSENDEGQKNFKWFINHYGVDTLRGDYLTVNFLWDYFFHLDNPDLDKTFQEAIAYYNNFSDSCENENQRSVLKATLVLFALQSTAYSTRTGGATSLLRASQKNICTCFVGTSFENDVRQILNIFASKGIVTAIQQSDDVYYVMATAQVDNERMEKLVDKVKHERNFDFIINDESLKIAKNFNPSNYLQYRYNIKFISPTKYLSTSHDDLRPADNKILAFYLFAADEEEQGKINQTIAKIYEKFPERCVVVDFSGTPFTKQRYEKFIQNKAKELYFREIPNQREQMTLAAKTANDLVEEWNRQLEITTYRVYSSATESNNFSGAVNLFRQLEELNRKFYGCGLEEISINDKLFSPQGFQDKVAKYALGKEKIPGSYSYLEVSIEKSFKEINGRTDNNYWKNNPSYAISKMKKIVEEIINRNLEKNNAVRFAEIWETLKKPPVGLMRSIGAAYLFALLLKEYADSNFYIRDINNNTYSLTADKMSNLIVNTVKESLQSDQFIVKQTPEHIYFCKVTGEIFNIPEDKRNSVDDIAKSVNLRLTQNWYPVWALKYYAEEKYSVSDYKDEILHFVDLMEEFINPQTVTAREKTKIAEDLYSLYKKNPAVISELKTLPQANNFKSGMTYYIAKYNPNFVQIVSRLKISEGEYLSQLNEKLSADSAYIWKIDDINKQIDKLYGELLLIEAINSVLATPERKLFDARESLREKISRIKIPRSIVEEFQGDLKIFFQTFQALQSNSLKNPEQMAIQIKDSAETFLNFFEKQSTTFYTAIRKYVDSELDDKTIENLWRNATGNFFKTKDDFILQIKQFLQNIKRNEQIQKLYATWQEVTGTKSPAEWSKQNKIPILCMFQDCLREAQNIFSALNRNLQSLAEKEVESALKFIQSDKLKCLQDKNSCEKAFVNFFGGEYAPVLQADELRKILQEKSGDNAYNWYFEKSNCEDKIEAHAKTNYHNYFVTQVQQKIHELSAEQAQKYLEELINKDVLLGIRVLKNS